MNDVVQHFLRYVVYVAPKIISVFMSSPRMQQWMRSGFLNMVNWTAVPSYWAYWDQILVYNHAALAFKGRPALLALIDLDE